MEGSVVWPTVALAKSRWQLCNTSVFGSFLDVLPVDTVACMDLYVYTYIYICIYL